jgi:hypothetical protein
MVYQEHHARFQISPPDCINNTPPRVLPRNYFHASSVLSFHPSVLRFWTLHVRSKKRESFRSKVEAKYPISPGIPTEIGSTAEFEFNHPDSASIGSLNLCFGSKWSRFVLGDPSWDGEEAIQIELE